MELAKPILAVIYRQEDVLREFLKELCLQDISPIFSFPSIQRYYSKEMGEGLLKVFISLKGLMRKQNLIRFKLWAMQKEREFSCSGRRSINIDPGYVDEHHLVLSSSKKRGGRFYLGEGVYAEMEYLFVYGSFRPLYWTYPDYRDERVRRFFQAVRERFLEELKTAKHGSNFQLVSFTQNILYETFQTGRVVGKEEPEA
ncbi:hypothetical protein HRbin13_00985 [bacterium HR13]|nr:hypothetical protein HRbin13_00985 [bacterium HR13]